MNKFFLKTEPLSLRLLKITLALCLATPLLAFSNVIFPYTVPKVFAFRILVEIAAIFYLYLALKYPSNFFFAFPRFSIKEKHHPDPAVVGEGSNGEGSNIDSSSRHSGTQNDKKGSGPARHASWLASVAGAVSFFLLISFLSALFGTDFYSSFWGNLERGMGVFGLLHFVTFFFMLISVFRIDSDKSSDYLDGRPARHCYAQALAGGSARHTSWLASVAGGGFKNQDFSRQLIILSVFTSTLISLLAILQHFFSLGILLPQADRVYSLIGNAGVLGSYLIFNIFLAGYLAISSLQKGATLQGNLPARHRYVQALASGPARHASWLASVAGVVICHLNSFGYCILFLVSCWALALTGTRGAWLGLLAGVIVFLVLIFFIPPFLKGGEACPPMPTASGVGRRGGFKGFKKLSITFLAIIFILAISLFFIRNSSFVQTNPTLSRLTSISLSNPTIQSRLILWQSAWQAWQKKPLLGWGPENFETAINKYSFPRLASFEAYSTDRAHNFIFDYGVTLGWLGLLSYLTIFFAAGWLLIKKFCHSERIRQLAEESKNPKMDPSAQWPQDDKICFLFSSIFISLLIAYLVQNLFIFDSFVSYLMLFFVLAVISSSGMIYSADSNLSLRYAGGFGEASQPPRLVFDSSKRAFAKGGEKQNSPFFKGGLGGIYFPSYKKLLLLFVIGILSFVIYSYNLKPLLSANYANQILSLLASEATQATPLLKNALALNSFASPEIAYQTVIDYIDKISQNPTLSQNEEFYNTASAELSKIIARSPNQSKNYIALSWLNLYFSGQAKSRIDQSLQLAQKVRELSPNKKDAYLLLVAGYALSSQPQKAQDIVDQALAIGAKMGEEVRTYLERLK